MSIAIQRNQNAREDKSHNSNLLRHEHIFQDILEIWDMEAT